MYNLDRQQWKTRRDCERYLSQFNFSDQNDQSDWSFRGDEKRIKQNKEMEREIKMLKFLSIPLAVA